MNALEGRDFGDIHNGLNASSMASVENEDLVVSQSNISGRNVLDVPYTSLYQNASSTHINQVESFNNDDASVLSTTQVKGGQSIVN